MLTFYDSHGLPNPDRIRIALEKKGVMGRVTVKQIDLWNGEHQRGHAPHIHPIVT